MADDAQRTAAFLLQSPVEFVLVGPSGGRDRILIRSKNAGLELIGAAQDGHLNEKSSTETLSVFFSTGGESTNVVSSYPLRDIRPEIDSRSSVYRFAWSGYATSSEVDRVRETLNLQLSDIQSSIRERNPDEIEWALAPVIRRTFQARARYLRWQRMFWIGLAIYAGIGLLAAVMYFFIMFFGSAY